MRFYNRLLLSVAVGLILASVAVSAVVSRVAVIGNADLIPQIIPSIDLALNSSKVALNSVGASVEVVPVELSPPAFPLEQLRELDSALKTNQFVAVINLLQSPVISSVLENSSVPHINVPATSKSGYLHEIYVRTGVNFFADALETLCHAFNWTRYSVVVSAEEENVFYMLRQEINRRAHLPNANITVSMIREFSTDSTILANHDESYANNVSIIVVIGKAKQVARVIQVSTQERDDRAQYVWLSPIITDSEIDIFVNEIEAAKPNYGGILAIVDDSSNDLVNPIMRNLTNVVGAEPSVEQRIAHDAMLTITSTIARLVGAAGDPADPTAFLATVATADFLGSTGLFEFNSACARNGDIRITNFAFMNNLDGSMTVQRRGFAQWSESAQLHQEEGTVELPLVWWDGSNTAPSDGFPRIIEFAIVAPFTKFPVFYQWEHALRMAKKHAKEDGILATFGLHLHFADSDLDEATALEEILHIISEEHIFLCVGEVASKVTLPLQYVLKSSKITQSSPIETSIALSDRKQNPYYARTVPSAATLYAAIAHAMRNKFGWKYSAMLTSSDYDGTISAAAFISAASQAGLELTISSTVENVTEQSVENALTTIKNSGTRVIVLAIGIDFVAPVFKAAEKLGMTGANGFVFILNDAAHLADTLYPEIAASIPNGVLTAIPSASDDQVFTRYRDDVLTATPQAHRSPDGLMGSTAYVYDLVSTMIRTVDEMLKRGEDYTDGSSRYRAMQRANFTGATGRIEFFNGDRMHAKVALSFRSNNKWVNFAAAEFLNITEVARVTDIFAAIFGDNSSRVPKDISLNFITWKDAAGLVITIVTILILVCVVGTSILICAWKKNPMVRASSPVFLQILLLGVAVAVVSVFPSTGELTDAACTARVWLFVLGFTLAYGACLLKNWRVWRLWSDDSMRIIRISNINLMGYGTIFLMPFSILLVIWTIVDRPRAMIRGANLVCEQGTSLVWPLLEFIGIGLMLAAGVILAFMTRAIPQLYNECKYIALASYNLTFCLIIGIALSFILQASSITAAYLCYTIGVLFAFGGMWAIIILPKLYLMVFLPEKVAVLTSGRSGSQESSKTTDTNSRSSKSIQGRGSASHSKASSRASVSKKQASTHQAESSCSSSTDSSSSEEANNEADSE